MIFAVSKKRRGEKERREVFSLDGKKCKREGGGEKEAYRFTVMEELNLDTC